MLATIDALNIIPRDNNTKPLLLIDGHKSQLEVLLLEYINTLTDHWAMCLGLPYDNVLCQVKD